MKYRANTNQMTETHGLVEAGEIIPDGALSEASIQRLLEMGLISEVDESEKVAAKKKAAKDG